MMKPIGAVGGRRLSLALLFLVGVLALGLTSVARAQGLDDLVLAVVHGEKITRKHLVDRLLDYHGETALDRAISRVLVQQAAAAAKVQVTDEDVAARLQQVRLRFKNDDAYQTFLRSAGLREEQHRQELRSSLLMERVAMKDVVVSSDDLKQYEIRMLVATDRAEAEKWAGELTPANFNQFAGERNADPTLKTAGGRMKPFMFMEMLEVFEALQKQNVKAGDFTRKPVELTGAKWVFVKLERVIPVSAIAASERERLEALLTRYHMDQWMAKTRTAAKIERRSPRDATPATVNGQPIPRAQLVARLLEFQGDEELDRMINRLLLTQAAKKQGVTLTDAETDQKLDEIRKQFPTPDKYQEFLLRANLTEKQFRDEVHYNNLLERVVLKETPIVDDDLLRYDVRMIIAPDRPTAESWIKELDNGSNFSEMAAARSQDPQGRAGGGRVKPFLRIELLDVWRAIQESKLKPGGYTRKPILLTDNSWAIVKLENLIPVATAPPQVRAQLTGTVRSYRITQWLDQTLRTAREGGHVTKPTAIGPAVIQGG